MSSSIEIYAGPLALEHLRTKGLSPGAISGVAAAAGGPKGLALFGLDQWLFGEFLPREACTVSSHRWLYGASIGAWRMAAASRHDSRAALERLAEAYLEEQRYAAKPTGAEVSTVCRRVVQGLIGGNAHAFLQDSNPQFAFHAIVARTRLMQSESQYKRLFAVATVNNTLGRTRLNRQMQRVILSDASRVNLNPFVGTGFATSTIQANANNLEDFLLASGSIPLLASPITRSVHSSDSDHELAAHAYWDGGLIDYHLYLPFRNLPGLVLYPHFSSQVTAGWLDKFLPWRKNGVGRQGRDWFDNLLLICPSDSLLQSLPNGKIPDRQDFYSYGLDHNRRIADWRKAMKECSRMAEDFARFCEKPELSQVKKLQT